MNATITHVNPEVKVGVVLVAIEAYFGKVARKFHYCTEPVANRVHRLICGAKVLNDRIGQILVGHFDDEIGLKTTPKVVQRTMLESGNGSCLRILLIDEARPQEGRVGERIVAELCWLGLVIIDGKFAYIRIDFVL